MNQPTETGMNKFLLTLFGVLCGLLGAGLILLTLRQPAGEPVQLLPLSTPAPVTIYLVGAVQTPGVYTLPAGSRLQDAVQAAGGFLAEANTGAVNLAALLADGERIVIPDINPSNTAALDSGLLPERSTELGALNLVNINTASQAELELLPGIGPKTAQKIIEFREINGPFLSIEAILDVPGIGEKTLSEIRDLITVGY
jgi:competence protein ComEA